MKRYVSVNTSYTQRRIEDTDTKVLSYAEIKAIATGNTAFLERAKIEGELARLETLQRNYFTQMETMRQNVYKHLPKTIADLTAIIPRIEQDIETIEADAKADKSITIAGATYPLMYDHEKFIIKALDNSVKYARVGDRIGTIGGLSIILAQQHAWSSNHYDMSIALQGSISHRIDNASVHSGRSAFKVCQSTLLEIPKSLSQKKEILKSSETALVVTSSMLDEEFEHEARITHLREDLGRLTREIANCS